MLLLTVPGHFICMQTVMDSQKPHDILESTTNTDGWKLELERVLPQLKVTIKTGMKLFPRQSFTCTLAIVNLILLVLHAYFSWNYCSRNNAICAMQGDLHF
jgi:hypothetical protein